MSLPTTNDAVIARREEIIARSVAVGEPRASIAIPPVPTAAAPAPVPSPAPTP